MSWVQHDKTLQDTITFTDKRKSPLVIQNQEALWRKLNNLKPFILGSNKELNISKEAKENALASCRGQITLTRNNNCKKNHYDRVSRPLSMKQAAEITFVQLKHKTLQSIIYPPEKKFIGTSSIWYLWGISRVLPADPLYTLWRD